ncbi:hypothetical protein [Terriglobus aquaticus]|uniref:Lipoprotein n=1 Tax=Terriglobus aquaticus TaxID=940139 RepID=A0ABW9KKU7_9BACT|nr:hypothetical protein [Terriglobus aquaticus]
MKKFVSARWLAALLLLAATALVAGCGDNPYHTTQYNYAGRAIPPSKLTERVLVVLGNSSALTSGAAQIIDAQRDIRFNVYQPNSTFPIGGFSTTGLPLQLFNYPEQQIGVVFANDRSVGTISYATEAFTSATLASSVFATLPTSLFVPSDRAFAYAAEETSGLFLVDDLGAGVQYNFSLPGAYRVAVNPAHTVVLIMTRNTDNVYRLLRLNTGQTPPAGAVDCQPLNLPVYCVLPVGSSQANGTISEPAFHRPQYAYFSPDGSQAYILSCGRECGGTGTDAQPAIHFANTASLRTDAYPTSATYTTPIVQTVNVPGATAAISDGSTVYVAGQQLLSDGYFSGVLSVLPSGATAPSGTYSISDGTHTKMLFADDNTLWIGSQNCASGERQAKGQNYNCLSVFNTSAKTANVVPNVTPGGSPTVPNPNENLDPYYYGSLTGICWVEGQHKIYTAYGGQVHAFHTADSSELDNTDITVQGTAIDVGYMDASTNVAN